MNDSGNDRKGGGFGEMPKWPEGAKDLPEERKNEPTRARFQWAFVSGVIGAMLNLLRSGSTDPVTLVAYVTASFVLFALIGLAIEYTLFDRERKRRKWY